MIPIEFFSFILLVLLCAYGHYSHKIVENNSSATKDVNNMTEAIIKFTLVAIFLYAIAKSVFKF